MPKFLTIKSVQPSDNGIVYNMINLDNLTSVEVYKSNDDGIVYNMINLDNLTSVEVYKSNDVGTVIKLFADLDSHYRLTVKESAEMVVDVLREDDPVLREAQTSNDAR